MQNYVNYNSNKKTSVHHTCEGHTNVFVDKFDLKRLKAEVHKSTLVDACVLFNRRADLQREKRTSCTHIALRLLRKYDTG